MANKIITVEILHTTEDFYNHHEFYNFRVVGSRGVGETTRLNFYNAKFRNTCGNTALEDLNIAEVVKAFEAKEVIE